MTGGERQVASSFRGRASGPEGTWLKIRKLGRAGLSAGVVPGDTLVRWPGRRTWSCRQQRAVTDAEERGRLSAARLVFTVRYLRQRAAAKERKAAS
jgi:hypothetical protein